jgi:hypothetical protein
MAAFWAVFTYGGSGPAITAHGSLDLKHEIQIQIQTTCPQKAADKPKLGNTGISKCVPGHMQTCDGCVNGRQTVIMLYSGCSTIGIKKELVHADQMLDETYDVMLFNGKVVTFPVALINIDCQFFRDTVKACLAECNM